MNWHRWLGMTRKGALRLYLIALWLLLKDPRTPLAAKVVAGLVVAYALSPVDLIPDFIPVLGQLDDLVVIPLGAALAVKLAPPPLWAEMQQRAEAFNGRLPRVVWGVLLVLVVWLATLGLFGWWLVRAMVNA